VSVFASLSQLPPDPLLGLMTAYRADPRAEKFDLGVGVYKNEAGETPVFRAVKVAEARLIERQTTKVYEGPRGNLDFCAAIERLVLGAASPLIGSGRITSFTTPGGCGALFLAAGILKRLGVARLWMSSPTWPNHPNVARFCDLAVAEYPYVDKAGGLDRAGIMSALDSAVSGDGVLIQGACHNPTGIDLTVEDWRALGALVRRKRLVALIDMAYQGFAEGLDADMIGPRAFLEEAGNGLIAYSCSKNFGLYRDRAGCFLALSEDEKSMAAVFSHAAALARVSYSMPPAHGAAIVAGILDDAALRADWEAELDSMRVRMISLRRALSDAMLKRTGSNHLAALTAQNGMFSTLPLSKAAITALREDSGVYMPESGRINIAGLNAAMIEPVADRLARALKA
jgi:aspartate aminotransferase/aromatic-amino-acid transaminase